MSMSKEESYLKSLFDTATQIDKLTKSNPCLCKIKLSTVYQTRMVIYGTKKLKPYRQKANEITTKCNCLLWGICVINPKASRRYHAQVAYINHSGIFHIKAMAHSYLLWLQLKDMVKSCSSVTSKQFIYVTLNKLTSTDCSFLWHPR